MFFKGIKSQIIKFSTTLLMCFCIVGNVFANTNMLANTIIPYDEELYLLAYNTFLVNQNTKDAYTIAELAVKAQPNNFSWRQRLAQVATWNNEPRIALGQWLYIADHQEDLNATEKGIELARMLNDYIALSQLFRLKIKYSKNEETAWAGYVEAEESLGDPQSAIKDLLAAIKIEGKLFYFEKLALLYRATGDIEAEAKTLELIESKFGAIPRFALRQAEILYSEGKIIEAQQKLMKAAVFFQDNDFEFWRTLGQLSWIVKDFKNAKIAYEKLKRGGKLDQYSLVNLIQLLEATNKKEAFDLAFAGWHKYKIDFFLLKILNFAPKLNEWEKLAAIIKEIPEDTKARLSNNLLYYSVRVQVFAKYGEMWQAVMVYEEALQNLPNSIELKIDYLWFLIDHEYTDVLEQKLAVWKNFIFTDVNFSNVYAAGYILLKNPESALTIYRKQFAKQQYDSQWLINFASTLEQLGRPKETTAMRELAWKRFVQAFAGQKEYSVSTVNDFARVAMYRQIGDISAFGLSQVAQNAKDQESNINLLTWALIFNNFELANYAYNFYGVAQDIPLWIRQTLALKNNDLELLNVFLQEKPGKLPYRDRVVAAARTGNKRFAETLAYRGLEEYPRDTEMYKLFTETMLDSADSFAVDSKYIKNGDVYGIKGKFAYTMYVTPRVIISPWVDAWGTNSDNSDKILSAASLDRAGGIKIKQRHKHGITAVNVGERHGLADFIMLELADSYRLTSKLNLKMSLGYQQTADETTALLIAGMKNEIKVGAEYQLTARDSLSSNLSYKKFKSQDGVFLGSGQILDIYHNHKFEFGYPDWNMSLFSSVNRYYDNGTVSFVAQRIIPESQTVSANFFIPVSFVRYGIGFGFGQAYREEYTYAWRPFAEVSVFKDVGIGLGDYLDIGVAGSVFGRDHLALYHERSTGVTGANQAGYIFGVSYKINF